MRSLYVIAIMGTILVSCQSQPPQNKVAEPRDTIPRVTGDARKPAEVDQQLRFWNEKLMAGIDFHATGNEPFWSLEIDTKKFIRFQLASGDSIVADIVSPTSTLDHSGKTYEVKTANGNMKVIIYDRVCVNDMSGDTIPKTVEVQYNGKLYRGCGRYLSDYRLNDTWVLTSVNDSLLDRRNFSRELPRLDINVREKRVNGHSGCNGFGGSVEVEGRFINFDRLIGTMMACDDKGFEAMYYRMLRVRHIPYDITQGVLTLYPGSDRLRYKKVD